MNKFTPIYLNTEYSFLQSTIKIDSLIEFALEKDIETLVMTDIDNMFGVAEFIMKCKKNNIKPVVGIDLAVEDIRVVLIAQNYDGFKQLAWLSSRKQKKETILLKEIDDNNLFIIDHPTKGRYAKTKERLPFHNYFIATDKNIGNAIYMPIVNMLTSSEKKAMELLDKLRDNGKAIHSHWPTDVDLSDPRVVQVMTLINQCNIEFPIQKNIIPKFVNDENLSSNAFLKKRLNQRIKIIANKSNKEEYAARVKSEVQIIEKLGFEDYFLVIADLIDWSRSQKILIGPGRGSASGSLVSYLLGITEIDPLEYGLLFERFLNPERVTMPDIDIDIQDDRRDEVISYLFEKYGEENVAQISTFSKLAAKSSIRDVARLLGWQMGEVNELSKLIPVDTTLQEAFDTVPKFRAAITKSLKHETLFEMAKMIEGLPRQHGTHPAGVVISSSPLSTFVPTILSSEGRNQLQFSMDYLEDFGLLKIDLLGLRNLSILKNIQDEIFKNYSKRVSLIKIPLDDKETNAFLSSGSTSGIFQLESYGMQRTLKQVGVDSFNDLVAIISLFRPGPMEYIGHYTNVKVGKAKLEAISPKYDEIVKDTMGIIVYQEQIMQIAQQFSGMSFGQADILRRAISKKNKELIDALKNKFVDGAIDNGHSKDVAMKVYKNIEKFADYGFNKSHAVAYGTLSYWLAYLKTHFPFEFYTALMEASSGSLSTIKSYIAEVKVKGIKVIAPNINKSEIGVANKDKKILMPLSMIKGLGAVANLKIINERTKNKFVDFFDVVARLKLHSLGDGIILSLIRGGALRDFGNNQTLIDSLPSASRYADMITSVKEGNKVVDFKMLPKPNLIVSDRNLDTEILGEQEVYGFNINCFPSTPYESEIKLIDIWNKKKVSVAVKLVSIRKVNAKNGAEMGIAKLQDSSSTIEAWIFQDVYKFIQTTKRGRIIKVDIEYKKRGNTDSFVIPKPWKEI